MTELKTMNDFESKEYIGLRPQRVKYGREGAVIFNEGRVFENDYLMKALRRSAIEYILELRRVFSKQSIYCLKHQVRSNYVGCKEENLIMHPEDIIKFLKHFYGINEDDLKCQTTKK